MPKCKKCGKRRARLSQRKLCLNCQEKIAQNVVAQLRAKNGPYYDKWKVSMRANAKKL